MPEGLPLAVNSAVGKCRGSCIPATAAGMPRTGGPPLEAAFCAPTGSFCLHDFRVCPFLRHTSRKYADVLLQTGVGAHSLPFYDRAPATQDSFRDAKSYHLYQLISRHVQQFSTPSGEIKQVTSTKPAMQAMMCSSVVEVLGPVRTCRWTSPNLS